MYTLYNRPVNCPPKTLYWLVMSCACIWLVKVVTLKGSLLFFISPPVQLKPGASAPSPDLPVDSIDVSLRLCVHDAGFICFPLPFQSKVSSPGSSLPPAVSVHTTCIYCMQLYTIISGSQEYRIVSTLFLHNLPEDLHEIWCSYST